MQLVDPDHPRTRAEARANPDPGPYTYGDPAVLAFFPDGTFLLGDGYWNSRIVKYDAEGNFLMEWGELGDGPGQFDLVHGLADRSRPQGLRRETAPTTASSSSPRTGEFIEEWPDISDPVGVFADENDAIWVISARLNRILKYDRDGQLLSTTGVPSAAPAAAFRAVSPARTRWTSTRRATCTSRAGTAAG